jgi:hypothetical protein
MNGLNGGATEMLSDERLIASIDALLDLDARKALVPHGIGGLARDLLTQSKAEIDRLKDLIDVQQAALNEYSTIQARLKSELNAAYARAAKVALAHTDNYTDGASLHVENITSARIAAAIRNIKEPT